MSLSADLKNFYTSECLPTDELDSLLEDYAEINNFWRTQMNQFSEIRLVLLGEAPLFGEKRSYFYNPSIGATAFFGYKHYDGIVGGKFGRLDHKHHRTTTDRKRWLLRKMRDAGIVVLDIFPLPLNKGTCINYGSLSDEKYKQLFNATVESYLLPKLQAVQRKGTSSTKFVFRYARLRDRIGPIFNRLFESGGFDSDQIFLGHVGSSYGNLDTELLKKIYHSTI